MPTQSYTTEKYYVRFDDIEESVYLLDTTDHFNDPSAFNKRKRGYKKFKSDMISAIESGDTSSFNDWLRAGNSEHYNLNMHYYCAVD